MKTRKMIGGFFTSNRVEQLLKRPQNNYRPILYFHSNGPWMQLPGKKHKMSMSVLDGLIQKDQFLKSMDQVNREAYADRGVRKF